MQGIVRLILLYKPPIALKSHWFILKYKLSAHLFCGAFLSFVFLVCSTVSFAAKRGGDADFSKVCYKAKTLVSVESQVEPILIESKKKPLVVVTDLFGIEYYSKIELVNESPYLWAVDHLNNLKPGIYLITSTSNNTLLKKTLVIQTY